MAIKSNSEPFQAQLMPQSRCLWRNHQPPKSTQIDQNRQPEHELITTLARLVPEHLLSQERTRPTAEQLQEMKGLFGCTLSAPGRGPLVDPVHQEHDKADGKVCAWHGDRQNVSVVQTRQGREEHQDKSRCYPSSPCSTGTNPGGAYVSELACS